jgi:hypothetical protein
MNCQVALDICASIKTPHRVLWPSNKRHMILRGIGKINWTLHAAGKKTGSKENKRTFFVTFPLTFLLFAPLVF